MPLPSAVFLPQDRQRICPNRCPGRRGPPRTPCVSPTVVGPTTVAGRTRNVSGGFDSRLVGCVLAPARAAGSSTSTNATRVNGARHHLAKSCEKSPKVPAILLACVTTSRRLSPMRAGSHYPPLASYGQALAFRETQPSVGSSSDTDRIADVALISVIATGTVGVLGSAGAVYAQQVSLKINERQRRDSWHEDLRGVLDDASQLAAMTRVSTSQAPTFGDVVSHYDKAWADISKQLGRLGIRLGPDSEVYKQYDQVRELANSVSYLASQFAPDRTTVGLSPNDEKEKEFLAEYRRLDAAVDQFLTAAAAVTHID